MPLLAPIAWSAADLLAAVERTKIKACPGPRCEWLFLDLSRNGSRRWCAMETCGNRAKAKVHYKRHRSPS